MGHNPEALYVVLLKGDTIEIRNPEASSQSMALNGLRRISVETNDSGPRGIDTWWMLEGRSPGDALYFPVGATGDVDFLNYAVKLPGFELRGMNSTSNARFECWPSPHDLPR